MQPNIRLSIIIPVLNERGNVELLSDMIRSTIPKKYHPFEIIFVDDNSDDGTQAVLDSICSKYEDVNYFVRNAVKSLSQSVIDGFSLSKGQFIVVMDGDLQHHPKYISELLRQCEFGSGISIASRYVEHGEGLEKGSRRYYASVFASLLAKMLIRVNVKDPMSGYFAIRRDLFASAVPKLSGVGYKILLELIYKTSLRDISEIPIKFDPRNSGGSKVSWKTFYCYFCQLLSMAFKIKSVDFVSFCLVGALGVLTHLFLLNVFYTVGLAFLLSYLCSALMVATQNYFLNQYLTFSDSRLKFSFSSRRLFLYLASNLINLIANTSIATLLFDKSGLLSLSSISGIIVGIIWNYTMARLILKE